MLFRSNSLTLGRSGTGALTYQGGFTSLGGLQNTPIGNATASTALFTTVSTSGNTTVSALAVNNSATIGSTLGVTGNLTFGPQSALLATSTTTGIGTTDTAIDSFAAATYRAAKYIITTTDNTNTQYQMCTVHVLHDGTNANVSPFGIVYSGSSARMTFSANIVTGTVTLYAAGVSANNTVKLTKTLIPV